MAVAASDAVSARGALGNGRCGDAPVGIAAGLVLVARAALGLRPVELAEAAGCDAELVRAIEAGRFDPALDTVERLVNSVGLEVRAGTDGEPGAAHSVVCESEVARVRGAFSELVEFRRSHGLRPPGPPVGAQPDWDGTDPAPPRLFGAGPTRRDGGGWAAILVRLARQRRRMGQAGLAAVAGLDQAEVAAIEIGALRPPVKELERVLSTMGFGLRSRLEPYDDHDDGLHLRALGDPGRYARRMRNGESAFATAVVLD
ncbi:MAG: helix-turn-helix transcriptional regulator [bacterium]|nr:helix-turn-helix transcriptional regulator [bacterium]